MLYTFSCYFGGESIEKILKKESYIFSNMYTYIFYGRNNVSIFSLYF